MGRKSCPSGYVEIDDEGYEECKRAAANFGQSELTMNTRGPTGCYWSSEDDTFYFSGYPKGKMQNWAKLVCKLGIAFCLY